MSRPWAGPEGRAVRRPRAGEGGAGIGAARSAPAPVAPGGDAQCRGPPRAFLCLPRVLGRLQRGLGHAVREQGPPALGRPALPDPCTRQLTASRGAGFVVSEDSFTRALVRCSLKVKVTDKAADTDIRRR